MAKAEEEIWIATEEIDEKEFEETRRCLLNTYHSYVQNHVGYMIAIVIGFVGLVLSSENFFKNIHSNYIFMIPIVIIFVGIAFYDFLRINYWTYYVSVAISIPKNLAIDFFNQKCAYPKKAPAPYTAILQIAIKVALRINAKDRKKWFDRNLMKLVLKTGG